MDRLTERLIERLTERLTGRLTDRLTDHRLYKNNNVYVGSGGGLTLLF